MPDESFLSAKAIQVVEHGKMPNRQPGRLWGGPGVGAPCTECGRPVAKDETELEVQFTRDHDAPLFDVYHVHVRCYAAWEALRTKRDGQPCELGSDVVRQRG